MPQSSNHQIIRVRKKTCIFQHLPAVLKGAVPAMAGGRCPRLGALTLQSLLAWERHPSVPPGAMLCKKPDRPSWLLGLGLSTVCLSGLCIQHTEGRYDSQGHCETRGGTAKTLATTTFNLSNLAPSATRVWKSCRGTRSGLEQLGDSANCKTT